MITKIKMEVTPDLSERVQATVFAKGGTWVDGDTEVVYTGERYYI